MGFKENIFQLKVFVNMYQNDVKPSVMQRWTQTKH